MKYKLLVLDVDGTVLNDAKEISKRTLALLKFSRAEYASCWPPADLPTVCCHWQSLLNLVYMAVLSFHTTAVR